MYQFTVEYYNFWFHIYNTQETVLPGENTKRQTLFIKKYCDDVTVIGVKFDDNYLYYWVIILSIINHFYILFRRLYRCLWATCNKWFFKETIFSCLCLGFLKRQGKELCFLIKKTNYILCCSIWISDPYFIFFST